MIERKVVFRHLLLICFVLNILPCHCQAVNEQLVLQLETIPEKDRESLSLFFEALIRLDTFGYTIFGDKPMSATGCWIKSSPFIFNKEAVFRKGQELWEKHSPKLHIKDFVFKFENTDDWYGIFLINKKAFIKVVDCHLDEFRKVLGKNVTPESLFLRIVSSKNSIGEVLKEDECLFGILFGYGYKNGYMYRRRQEVIKNLKACFIPPPVLPQQAASSNYDAQALLSEYINLKTRLKESSGNSKILDLFPEVGFLADLDDEETKKLLQHYNEIKFKIFNAFLSNNFLEAVLCKMTSGQPLPPQGKLFEQKFLKNIEEAENFLSLISQKPNIKVLIPGKLYFEVLNEGNGQTIASISTVLFHYKITILDKTVIVNTYEEEAKKVSLANTIVGFAKGVEGMKYGEKRILYVHPDLAYRKIGIVVPPQALLIIEVQTIESK